MKKIIFFLIAIIYVSNAYNQTEKEYSCSVNQDNLDKYDEYIDKGNAKLLRDPRGAVAEYTKAIELNPDCAELYMKRAIAKGESQDYRGAIADYTQVIKLDHNNFYDNAYSYRGTAKEILQDYNGAIADFTKAIEVNPNAGVYLSRGNSKFRLQDYNGAITDFTKAIEIDSSFATPYYARGISKITLGQLDSGCLDLTKAGEWGYSDAYDAIKKYCN